MIPDFNEHGYLPPGIHRARLAEIEKRFGKGSEIRRVQMQSLHWLVDLAKRAGIERLIINGSFVTDVFEPNDVDCVLRIAEGFPLNSGVEEAILAGLPFLDIHLVDQEDFDYFTQRLFAEDRQLRARGMIEVRL